MAFCMGEIMRIKSCILSMLACLSIALAAQAVETQITVRVLAKDAKFIGSGMGGAEVTVTDVETGAVLASGLTAGSTGSTDLIMRQPRKRYDSLVGKGAAHFSAMIDLEEPRLVEVTASGPVTPAASRVSASSRQWVVPGKHVNEGNAWILELRGLVVELPDLPEVVKASKLHLEAKVRMLCGCPTEPGGLWDSDKMEIKARLEKDGAVTEVPLSFTGITSHFAADVPVQPGSYTVMIYAYQPATGNTGVLKKAFTVQ